MNRIAKLNLRPRMPKGVIGLAFGLLLIPFYVQTAAAQSTVHVGIDNAQVVEGNPGTHNGQRDLSYLQFSVGRGANSDLGNNILIPYTVTPSGANPATPGVDYIQPPVGASVSIPAGQRSGALRLPVIPDTVLEPDETLLVQLGKAVAFAPGVNFLTAPSYPAGNSPGFLASGDFNGDGYPDLVVTNVGSHAPAPNQNSVSVLLGNGTGGFAAPVEYPLLGTFDPRTVSPTVAATVADVNGDGKLDLAVAISYGGDPNADTFYQLAILLGDGAGDFAAPSYYSNGSPAPGPDGNPGPFGIQSGASLFAFSIVAADFNGDGKLDLAISNGGVLIMLGDGRGGFTARGQYFAEALSNSDPAYALAVGDFNGDGHRDVAATNLASANISILLGDGTGGLGPPINYGGGARLGTGGLYDIVTGDFDLDGKIDLAVVAPGTNGVASSNGVVAIFRGDGAGGFAMPTTAFPVGSAPVSLVVRDFDGDGKLDFAVSNSGSRDVSILRGDGTGGFAATGGYAVNGSAFGLTAADFNRDGHLDLAVGGTLGVSVLLGGADGGFVGPGSYSVGSNPLAVAAIADNAGRPGLITANGRNGSLSFLPNNGSGRFGAATALTLPGNPTSVAIADFDGDGQPDLAVTERAGGGFTYENVLVVLSGSGPTTAYPLDRTTAGAPTSVAAGDLTGDGFPDLVVTNVAPSNTVSILVNNGAGVFSPKANLGIQGSVPMSVILRDFNGDGLLDIATANRGSNDVSIRLGLGAAEFAPATTYPVGASSTSASPTSVAAGDFDEDGDLDLAVANFGANDNTVSILRNNGDGTFTAAGSIQANQPGAVTTADFDGDGHLDLAVANSFFGVNSVSILLGNGAGGFAAPVNFGVGSVPVSLVAIDVDGDGDPDLAVANQGSNSVTVLLNSSAQSQLVFIDRGTATGTILNDDAPSDTTPDRYRFIDVSEVPLSSVQTSNSVGITGINAPTAISVTGGQYSIGCGEAGFTANPGTIASGATVCVRMTSSAHYGTEKRVSLNIGGIVDRYSTTTLTRGTKPTAFRFFALSNVARSSINVSNPVTPEGLTTATPISVTDGQYSIGCTLESLTASPGTIEPGQTVCVLQRAAPSYSTAKGTELTVGSATARFSTTTIAAPAP